MDTVNPQNSAGGLDKPAGAPTGAAPVEPVIHVIPEMFYGAALRKKVVEPKKEPPKPVVAPPPKLPPGPPGAAPPPRPKSKLTLILIIVGAVLLLGGATAGAYYFLFAKKPAQQVAVDQNFNVGPKSFCGDKKCDPAESSLNCPADCGPPPAVCGDKKCDTSESTQNCPADCGPPAPVCGDNKCDPPEDFKNCAADCQPPEPKPGLDSDSDGVTDIEETRIYGTDPYDPDSDHDSFVDLNEVLNLFDPAKPRPSMLKDNPGIALYRSAEQAFEIFYPARWTKKDSADEGIVFAAPSGEFIQVLLEPNKEPKDLMEWYLAQAPGVRSSEVQMFKTNGGYDEVLSADRFTAFMASGHRVFVISYNLGSATDIQFKATFSMMINSLLVTGDPALPEKAAPPVEPVAPPVDAPAAQPPEPAAGADVFPDMLSACTPYKTKFTHPFTGESMEKEIVGLIDGKCDYLEQMPNGGKMECKYVESMRLAVAKYYKDLAAAETAETSVTVGADSETPKVTYTIDGKAVENPLQEAMDSGVCVITGYPQ